LKCLLYVERGEVACKLQQYQLAISDTTLAIEINPRNVRALVCQCDSFIACGRVVEARDNLLEIKQDWAYDNEKIKKAFSRAEFEWKILETDKQLRAMVSDKRKSDPNSNSEKRQEGRNRRNSTPTQALAGIDREIKRKSRNVSKRNSNGDKSSETRTWKAKKEQSPNPEKVKNSSKGGLFRSKSRVKERPVMSEEDARRRMSLI